MTIKYVSDHVLDGLDRVISRFDHSPRLRGFIAALLDQVQEVEGVLLDLFYSRTLDGATDAQLDVIGRVVGEPRDGLDDAAYRRFIRARLSVNLSQGERERLKDIVRATAGTDDVQFVPNYPAAFVVYYLTRTPLSASVRNRIKAMLLDATGSGIGLDLVEADEDYFGFAEDDAALGFDEGTLSTLI